MKRCVSIFLLICMMFMAISCNTVNDTEEVEDMSDKTVNSEERSQDTETVLEAADITPQNGTFIKWFGRVDNMTDGSVKFDYTASGFEVKFRGSKLMLTLDSTNYNNASFRAYVTVIIDGEDYKNAKYYALDEQNKLITLELSAGEHTVRVLKRSEALRSSASLKKIETDGVFLQPDARRERYIEFYGDSITCGYGNKSSSTNDPFTTATEDGLATYAFLTSEGLGAECSVISQSGIAINKNVNEDVLNLPALVGKRSYTDPGEYKPERTPDVVVIYGGVNDRNYLTAAPNGTESGARAQAFIDKYAAMLEDILMRYPGVTIFCCCGMYDETSAMGILIKRAINKVGSENVVYTVLPAMEGQDGRGSQGHPTYISHEKAAAALTTAIKTKMKWD